uniref:NADH-ubiquinone oxidoreductase chain 4L n=2 Tax=Gryllotalpa TaxID=208679 RepID=A0A0U1VUY4_GRYUN|nr:NADH dehydrogenase subunit 4L [Gryllotalpa unispina]AGO20453.1 NADH dehydrogenase subunit 4L [Gryllotalpa unispina]QOL00604.1 NADH dehydrogenase subunit 4L [Gryllotalpa sp. YH-2020]
MFNQFYVIVFYLMFFAGVWMFISKRKHLLVSLLSLEYMMLMLFMIVYLYLLIQGYELYFSMVFLTFSVCEGALGLAVLVSIIRTHGNDYFHSISMLKC